MYQLSVEFGCQCFTVCKHGIDVSIDVKLVQLKVSIEGATQSDVWQ